MPHYHVQIADLDAHLLHVTLTVEAEGAQRLSLPAWIPGSYLLREFAKHIVRLEASRGGAPVALTRLDRNTWEAPAGAGTLVVFAEIYAYDLSVRCAHVDRSHAFFNGTGLFLRVHGQESAPHRVTVAAPAGRDWRLATSMRRLSGDAWGFGGFEADDYDDLVDHPFEAGALDVLSFDVEGVPHHLVLSGRHQADLDRLARDLPPICAEHARMFEGLPIDRYVFISMIVGEGYGGLEHRYSTALLSSRDDLPKAGDPGLTDGYKTYLHLCSHEYFHLWNVKRIRPARLTPYDYQNENYTTLLWAFEGITSYYDNLACTRAGVFSQDDFLGLLGETATRVLRGPGRHAQSLSDSSFDAWTKFYRPTENTGNQVVSYYAKGSLAALALDLEIRRLTDDARCLDDLMRLLWNRYGQVGEGVPEDGVEAAASEIAGADLSAFFDAWIRGTADQDLNPLLARYGVRLHLRPADAPDDKGGRPSKLATEKLAARGWAGLKAKAGGGGAELTSVAVGSPAAAAGLWAGDLVIAVDGLKVGGDLEKRLAGFAPGSAVAVHAFRRDELFQSELRLAAPPVDTAWFERLSEVDEATAARRDAWLGVGRRS